MLITLSHCTASCRSLVDRCVSLESCKSQIYIFLKYMYLIIRIYTAKSCPSTPKRQRDLSSAISSSMFWLLMKSPSPCSSMIVAVLLFSYHAMFTSKSSLVILRWCPYHFNCLLWILFKIDCSACILFLMAVLGIFCNLNTLSWPS